MVLFGMVLFVEFGMGGLTNGRTLLDVKLLSRLKRSISLRLCISMIYVDF